MLGVANSGGMVSSAHETPSSSGGSLPRTLGGNPGKVDSPTGPDRWSARAIDRPLVVPPVDNGPVTVEIASGKIPQRDELAGLYDAVGWSAYTRDLDVLERALQGSTHVATARRDGRLVGLARVVSDGVSIAYLQDILVRPDEQGGGLGKRLVTEVLGPFAAVRQKVLLTDDEPRQRAFYESLGFAETRDFEDGSLRAFVRFD